MDWHGLTVEIRHHEAAVSAMPDELVGGRNLRDGYLRGTGIQFGNLPNIASADPVFVQAYKLAQQLASPVGDCQFINFYFIIRYGLAGKVGNIAEFGTHRGGSAIFLAAMAREYLPQSSVYCFDSFAGMPAASANDVHQAGDFADYDERELLSLAADAGLENIKIVKGYFQDTIREAMPKIGPLVLVHIDGDLYQSVSLCYHHANKWMHKDGYIVFDDPLISSCIGAFDAVSELVIQRDRKLPEQVWPHMVFRGQ